MVKALAGDLIMLPRGFEHVLSDGSEGTAAKAGDLMDQQLTSERLAISGRQLLVLNWSAAR